MRLFLGLEIPDAVKEEISLRLKPLQKSTKGWENAHDYHQTILFIGEASQEDLLSIKERMDQINFQPFKLTTCKFDFFSRRIMYLSFHPSSELMKLKDEVERLFSEWVRPGSKPFIAHVTVKRWQRYEYDQLKEGLASVAYPEKTFEVKNLSLYKSEKDSRNNKYHVIYQRGFNQI
jgi:2'-5' RNA ligase